MKCKKRFTTYEYVQTEDAYQAIEGLLKGVQDVKRKCDKLADRLREIRQTV